MAMFALVHGAWHGGWCFERLIPELEARGHRALAMDLPCDAPEATFSDYADVVVRALEGVEEEVVVVAHSLGGQTGPLVPARRPVRAIVYLCALVAWPNRSFLELAGTEEGMLLPGYEEGVGEPDTQGRRHWVDAEVARRTFFADCEPDVARTAFDRLRPQASAPYLQPCPLDALPEVPTMSIVCDEDRIVGPDWSRRTAKERLGVVPVELPGSHSPFLSRPADLAAILTRVVTAG
jgi:pimeloyl-ACP methyl ester carboxylesterase